MRRLHRRLYLAIVGTLLAFLVCGLAAWHFFAAPVGAVWGVESAAGLIGAQLDAAPDDARRRALLALLVEHQHANVGIYEPASSVPVLASGAMFVLSAEQLARRGWQLTRAGPIYIRALADGRLLVVHPRRRYLLHGLHMGVLLTTIAVVLALLTYPITRGITARLGRLEAGVRRFGDGDLAARVPVEGRDEVAALATSFNDSAARIERLLEAHRLLLANCSHELRTPLTRLRLAIEKLGERPANDELTRNIAELDALIGEMLLSSRLEATPGLPRAERVDLLALVAEEASHYDRDVDGAAATLTGDPTLLRRLVRNLLENARVHAGGVARVAVEADERTLRIVVEDAGPGVPEAERQKIFEPFHRSGAGERAGSGLGLALVRQIARAHGGEVACEPRAGGGTRFVVTLPAR